MREEEIPGCAVTTTRREFIKGEKRGEFFQVQGIGRNKEAGPRRTEDRPGDVTMCSIPVKLSKSRFHGATGRAPAPVEGRDWRGRGAGVQSRDGMSLLGGKE